MIIMKGVIIEKVDLSGIIPTRYYKIISGKSTTTDINTITLETYKEQTYCAIECDKHGREHGEYVHLPADLIKKVYKAKGDFISDTFFKYRYIGKVRPFKKYYVDPDKKLWREYLLDLRDNITTTVKKIKDKDKNKKTK